MAVENLILDGLQLNDEVNLSIEGDSFKFTPAQKRPQFIDNPDADGAALAYEPNYTNAEFALGVRIVPKTTMDIALAAWAELEAKLQKASLRRDQGGIPLEWTPAGASKTYTYYVLLGEISELPITPTGDLAGWFINSPVISIKLVCAPFGKRPPRTILAETANATPLQSVELPGVGGDVPAEGQLIVIEKTGAGADRRHLEWGLDQNTGTVLLTASSFTTTGFSGTPSTRTGAYSEEKTVKAPAIASPTAMFSTGAIAMIGTYRVKARVFSLSSRVRYRLTYRVGDGIFKTLEGTAAAIAGGLSEVDLGTVTLEELPKGTQRSEMRVEIYAVGEASEGEVNYLILMPTASGWGKARGVAQNTPNKLLAYDEFNQSEGNLEGKAAAMGGTWAEASKTGENGFIVAAENHSARRAKLSDASLVAGSYALVGSEEPTTSKVTVQIWGSTILFAGGEHFRRGALLRYTNPENCLFAVLVPSSSSLVLKVIKRVGGTSTTLAESELLPGGSGAQIVQFTVSLLASADGTWQAWAYPSSESEPAALLSGQDAVLATSGTLAKGKAGIYDAETAAVACTRNYDNFSLLTGEAAARVCYASRQVEVRSDETERQDSTGAIYARLTPRGSHFFVPVGTSRLVVKMRRNDVDLEPDTNVTDNQALEVKVTERFLAPQ